jgi:parallel beta-helix repeat protein
VVGVKSKIIIVTVVIALSLLFSGTALAKTVTVDDSGGCDYTSIQDAINNSIEYYEYPEGEIYYYSPSDLTIIVYPGVYQESVKVFFPLSLKAYSSNPADTVIESEGYAIYFSDYYGWLMYSGFSIYGFTINGTKAGIYEEGSIGDEAPVLDLKIENNVIVDGNYGVRLCGDYVTIKNNTFKNNMCGLYLIRCGPSEVIENEFIDNDVGLKMKDSSEYLENNLFTKNGLAISSIYGGNQIIGNTIRDNTAGISVSAGVSLIASNVITGNAEYGINSNGQILKIYNNYFNNKINLTPLCYSGEFSIEAREGPNIIGGPSIGGNFWGKPDDTGFSQTHADTDMDGFCDEPYVLNEYSIDYLPLKEITIPIANFSTNVTEGSNPLFVQFIDLSEHTTGISWDFENDGRADIISNGSIIGTESDPNIINDDPENPVYVYTVPGEYTINLTVWNENGTDSKLATITVSSQPLPPFPGYDNPPSDLDQDGLYEDVNGNEILDFDDVVAYYDNMEWIEENMQLELFDYNNNELIDFDDVVKLYDML